MPCRSGCKTQDHATYGECCRAGAPRVIYSNEAARHDYTAQRKWDQELADYRAARAQGIEPAGTDRRSIDEAVKISDFIQKPFDAHKPTAGLIE